MGLEISWHGKVNYDQSGLPSITSCDGIEKKSWQTVKYIYGNQAVLRKGSLQSVQKY